MGSRVQRTRSKAAASGLGEVVDGRAGIPHSRADKPGGTTGE